MEQPYVPPSDNPEDSFWESLQPVPQRISFHAPRRCSKKSPNGYTLAPWDIEDIKFAISAGAWFKGIPGFPTDYHVYASSSARKFAESTM